MNMIRAGFAIADITPRGREQDLNGFAARVQPSTRVAAPVSARVVLLDDGRARVVIAVCDLLGFRQRDSVQIERAIGKAIVTSADRVLLACTHNHSGPVSMPLGRVGRFHATYLKQIERRLILAARAAKRDLQKVTGARFGTQSIPDLGEYRCCRQEPGRARWPGVVTALRLDRAHGGPITLCHAGIHPYLLGWESRVMHPDFPLPLCAALERRSKGRAVFLPGCGADVSPVPAMRMGLSAVERYGRKLARAAERALRRGKPVPLEPFHSLIVSPTVRFNFRPVLPKRRVSGIATRALVMARAKSEENLREWKKLWKQGHLPREGAFRLHLLRLGELCLIGIPAEVFAETGIDLQRALRNRRVMVVSHAGGNWGYLPRPFSYTHKTYESSIAHHWYRTAGGMARGTEATVRSAALRAAKTLLK